VLSFTSKPLKVSAHPKSPPTTNDAAETVSRDETGALRRKHIILSHVYAKLTGMFMMFVAMLHPNGSAM
jgi:hypothetical protein